MDALAAGEPVRSRRRVCPRPSRWRVQQFSISAGGGVLCRAAVLGVADGALLLWVGGEGAPVLGAVALAVPGDGGHTALATTLTGEGMKAERAASLSQRLAAALARPVHVCFAAPLDRFTAPLVERGLIAEIKKRDSF